MTDQVQPAPIPRPAHESLIDEFHQIDEECQQLVNKFTSGSILFECLPSEGATTLKELVEKMVAHFNAFQEYLKGLIEKRNAKLQEAAAALRSTVMAGDNVVRGPDGKASTTRYGDFEVTSKTSRSFDHKVLFEEVQKLGLYERLLDLTFIDRQTGNAVPAVKEEWKVDYNTVKNWLRETNNEQILNAAYEEEEGTPAVSGPKPIGWIGEADKSKGKK